MSCQSIKVACTQFWFAFELGDQAIMIIFPPTLLGAVAVDIKLAFPFVIDDICIALLELLQFLLAGSDGKGSIIDTFKSESVVWIKADDLT